MRLICESTASTDGDRPRRYSPLRYFVYRHPVLRLYRDARASSTNRR